MHKGKEDPLRNYRQLVDRVDTLCRSIADSFPAEVTCHRGCDACCRHLTLFPVEGAALRRGLVELASTEAEALRHRVRLAGAESPCPLLVEGSCLLYPFRPLICRTHGYPLLLAADSGRRIDYCPRNFQGIRALPAGASIDLNRLNVALAAVNALFLREVSGWIPPERERLSLAEFLLLDDPFPFSV